MEPRWVGRGFAGYDNFRRHDYGRLFRSENPNTAKVTAMPKILVTATVPVHVESFHLPVIRKLAELGWEVDVATNGVVSDEAISHNIHVDWSRSPVSRGNIRAFRELKSILIRGDYDVVYCHTPVGAAITRLAAVQARKAGARVVYMVHGFHFYRGAPLANWLIYFPVEWALSWFTDEILTINREDYVTARSLFHAHVRGTLGVGVDLSRFAEEEHQGIRSVRSELGISHDAVFALCIAELSRRKNQEALIRALPLVLEQIPDFHLVFAGAGDELATLEELAVSNGTRANTHFLGYRRDVPNLLEEADFLVSASKQEGLPQNIIEAIAAGKPVIASNIRGHTDLLQDYSGGRLVDNDDVRAWSKALISWEDLHIEEYSHMRLLARYDVERRTHQLSQILMERVKQS